MLTITATDLPRLMGCQGSLNMTGFEVPDIETDDTVKDEGNAADWLVGEVHSGRFMAEELIDRKAPNGTYIDAVMVEYLEEYLNSLKKPDTLIEHDTSHGNDKWQINGRTDSVWYQPQNQHLHVQDLKYGWRIVEPENNWTLISHALGFWFQNPGMQIATVTFTIHQPRPHHPRGRVRSWTITGEELVAFYNQINETLSNPSNVLQTGDHCYKCPAMLAGACPAVNKAKYNSIEASERAFVDEITDEALAVEIGDLERAQEMLKQILNAYNDLALHRIKKGKIIKGFMLDIDYARTSWKKHVTPDMVKAMSGVDVQKKTELITPNQAKNAGVSEALIAAMTERRKKGLKLVRGDINKKAQKIFNPE